MIVIKTRAIKFWIQEAGFRSQAEFARAANIDRSRLNKIINNSFEGGLSLATVDKLCAVLDCQPGEILEYRPEK
jgi:DNA-binding Xre family transcriptional regulator